MRLVEKIEGLRQTLCSCGRVAIAFSGGIDSSLLLKCALQWLGAGNVLVLFGQSELIKPREIDHALHWLPENGYAGGVDMEIVFLTPLLWKEFASNQEDRCYSCKFRMYSMFLEIMERRGFSTLLDGTNTDDLKQNRPGLRAIHALGVRTPLVEAGLDKADIRRYAEELGLRNWNHPSSSCLATRIPFGVPVTGRRLARILCWEEELERLGFAGCRVRMDADDDRTVHIQIDNREFGLIGDGPVRAAIVRFFHNDGIDKVLLDLEGR